MFACYANKLFLVKSGGGKWSYTGTTPTCAATYDGSTVTGYYADGQATTQNGSDTWSSRGNRISVGCGYSTVNYVYMGNIYAIRLYSNALTADQIAYNANLDKVRFEDVEPSSLTWPDGYRWSTEDARLEIRLNFVPAEGGSISATVDGEAVTEFPVWTTNGAAVAVSATGPEGTIFASWIGNAGGIAEAALSESTLAFKVSSEPVTLTANFRQSGATHTWRGTTSALASVHENWAEGIAPYPGDAIVLDADSGDLTWDIDNVTLASWTQTEGYTGTVTFATGVVGAKAKGVAQTVHGVLSADGATRELVVTGAITLNGGTWKQKATPAMANTDATWIDGRGVYRLIARAGGAFSVGENVTISGYGAGFQASQGPGYSGGGRGSSHGGCGGGIWANAHSYLGNTYGSIRAPVTQGSGGGGVGGGAVELSAGGAFTHNGVIQANGTSASHYTAAGGSVFITAATLSGSGSIQAKPAIATNSAQGGGGRIALVLTGDGANFDSFTGETICYGEHVTSNAGTVYKETPVDKADGGVLQLRGSGSTNPSCRGLYTLLKGGEDDNFDFAKIIVTNKVNLGIGTDATVRAKTMEFQSAGNYLTLVGGTLVVPNGYTFTNVTMRNEFYNSGISTFDGAAGTNTLAKGVTFTMEREITFGGTFRMLSGSTVNHTYNGDTDAGYRANFSAENFLLDNGATITVDSAGFNKSKGPGAPTVDGYTARSGSHGGLAHDVGGIKAYGSITRPVTLGSGGQYSAGSGATHIRVKGLTTVNGTITASANNWYYSGAAGSIWLETGRLQGASTGQITANGCHKGYDNSYYGSGGGRVAVTLTAADADFSDYLGVIQANGARYNNGSTFYMSGSGTVYLRKGGEAENEGTLIIDSPTGDFVNTDNYTDISDAMTECLVGHVVITNGGNLRASKGGELQVRKSFTNASRFQGTRTNGEAGDDDTAAGAVAFVDNTVEAVVTGTNSFMCLKCNAPGKTVRFGAAADSQVIIPSEGSLTVTGEEETPVYLRGLADGTAWLLDFHGKAAAVYADVKDSDASSGSKVSVDDTNVDSGNNLNWGFVTITPGETITWLGSLDNSWATADNWDKGRAPVDTDVIVISDQAVCTPALGEAVTLNRLEIPAGKTLRLSGFSLTVTNGLDCAGTLACSGTETITLSGAVTLKNFTAANSTLVLADTAAQTADLGGQSYHRITVGGPAPSLTLTDGFTADYFTCIRNDAAFDLVFAVGKTVTVGQLELNGVIEVDSEAAAGMSLSSTDSGNAWKLNVTGKAYVIGVKVRCSNAIGLRVAAYEPSVNDGNNVNWLFGVKESVWQGAAGANWSEAANWVDGKVPDGETRVLFSSDATVTIDTDGLFLMQLEIENATVNLQGAHTLTVASLLDILDGGTLNQASSGNVVRVTGSAYVRSGGVWTHSENGKAAANNDLGYGVSGIIDGDFMIEQGGKVTAYGKGFYPGRGPGTQSSASYGGKLAASSKPCYGSIFTPVSLGSGGGADHSAQAGGRIHLQVGGTLTVAGEIDADGKISGYYNSSGGSIWIDCGTLSGAGEVHANGADITGSYDAGCGGRVAVYQRAATDFAAFTGKITAYGGLTAMWRERIPIVPPVRCICSRRE